MNQLDALRAQLEEIRTTRTDRHPDVLALQAQIAMREPWEDGGEAREVDPQSRSELLRAAEQTSRVLQQQLEETERELTALDQRIGGTPAVQEQQAAMEERALILRENYLEFLRKVHNSQLSEDLLKAQQGERVSIVNEAQTPSQPQNTPWRYLIIGLLSTLAGALARGLALEWLDPVIDSSAQVEHLTSVPVLGWAPRIR